MKYNFKLFLLAAATLFAGNCMTSCSDDDLGPSIFDTTEHPLDRTSYTFPLDTFIKKNYQEPYNLRFVYKMEDIGSDMQKNLIPASYEKSTELAVLGKYLWYDVYKKVAGEEFLKLYSPRIIHVIGSPSYNPSSGTETLGEAEGGLKITLYNTNNLDASDIDNLNEKFFKTMHHEFGHILAQNVTYPTSFPVISQSLYNAINWDNDIDSLRAAQGFVSPYGGSQAREDWVEVMANYIVKDSATWNGLLNTARYDWETVEMPATEFRALESKVTAGMADRDTVGYFVKITVGETQGISSQQWMIKRKVVARNSDGSVALTDGKIVYPNLETGGADGINGRDIILQKLDLVRTWLKENFGVDIDQVRKEVQTRQWATNPDGSFKLDSNGNYINKLTEPSETDPSKTLLETLVDEVKQYESLRTK